MVGGQEAEMSKVWICKSLAPAVQSIALPD